MPKINVLHTRLHLIMKYFILHQSIWIMELHWGHITDEEWSICGEYNSITEFPLVLPDTPLPMLHWKENMICHTRRLEEKYDRNVAPICIFKKAWKIKYWGRALALSPFYPKSNQKASPLLLLSNSLYRKQTLDEFRDKKGTLFG